MNIDYELGDTVECPVCLRVFEITRIDDEELDDSDLYFEHITMCDGGKQHGKNKIF
ncbi:hypothetical protein N6H13_25910 [Paenibacillus sp. CC-CFT742]|nr:hypothetical protein [Paenibacillus sp. CC-CFT742]WJH28431.1 hypothetical protein N6H13_25910 [Paenibacillus sp. CC-CFT742]